MQTPTLSLAARSPDLDDLIEKARAYIHAAKSPAMVVKPHDFISKGRG